MVYKPFDLACIKGFSLFTLAEAIGRVAFALTSVALLGFLPKSSMGGFWAFAYLKPGELEASGTFGRSMVENKGGLVYPVAGACAPVVMESDRFAEFWNED